MPDGSYRVIQNHSRTSPAHHFAHSFLHLRAIAVDGTLLHVGLFSPNLQRSSLTVAYCSNSWHSGHNSLLLSFFLQYIRIICSTTRCSSFILFILFVVIVGSNSWCSVNLKLILLSWWFWCKICSCILRYIHPIILISCLSVASGRTFFRCLKIFWYVSSGVRSHWQALRS